MGDYGFEGAGEFPGQDTNFNTLPDHYYTKCPNRKIGLQGDFDNKYGCLLTEKPDADGKGFGYDLCNLVDDDYSRCPRILNLLKARK